MPSYTAERTNIELNRVDHTKLDTEVIYYPPSGPPRIVCVAAHADAKRIAAMYNAMVEVPDGAVS